MFKLKSRPILCKSQNFRSILCKSRDSKHNIKSLKQALRKKKKEREKKKASKRKKTQRTDLSLDFEMAWLKEKKTVLRLPFGRLSTGAHH